MMFGSLAQYFDALASRFGDGWNRFWYQRTDPCTLCVMRVLTGLVALYMVGTYSFDLDRFFGPSGMLPVETVARLEQLEAERLMTLPRMRFSYLDYIGNYQTLQTAHILGLAVLACFTLGVLTRVSSVLALVVVLSYFHRGPMLTLQAESILAMLMFYLCFAPCGAWLSVDRHWARRRQSAAPAPEPADAGSFAAGIVTRLIQVHLALIYAMSVFSMLSAPTWWEGSAVWWLVTRVDTRLVDLSGLLYDRIKVVNFWTHCVVAYSLAMPILCWHRLARPLLVALGVLVWLPLGLVTGWLTYAALMMIAGLVLVSPEQMRALFTCCRAAAAAQLVPLSANSPEAVASVPGRS